MGLPPLALSVHNFISSVGADAGFAAIIGLAILVLLYFAHARETANLREEATLLTERLQQAEARVAQLSRAQPAAAPQAARPAAAPAPPVQRAPVSAVAAGLIPAAPAGVGAPALAAATRVVPVGAGAGVLQEAAAPAAIPQQSAAVPAAPAAAGTTGLDEPEVRTPAPATVAGSNGAAHEPVGAPVATAPVSAGPAAGQGRQGLPPYRPEARPAGERRPLPPIREAARTRSPLGRRLALLIGALGVIAVIAVLVIATSGGSTPKSGPAAATQTTNLPAPKRSQTPAFSPASVTVAVLNGTSTNQLAHTVGSKLAAAGYKEGALKTAANQTQAQTVVAYLPGATNRTDALHVATALHLGPSAVQPIDQPTQQVACPPPGACTANVVVTVGADLATL